MSHFHWVKNHNENRFTLAFGTYLKLGEQQQLSSCTSNCNTTKNLKTVYTSLKYHNWKERNALLLQTFWIWIAVNCLDRKINLAITFLLFSIHFTDSVCSFVETWPAPNIPCLLRWTSDALCSLEKCKYPKKHSVSISLGDIDDFAFS